MEKKKKERWLHPEADFPIIRTKDMQEAMGKYLAEPVIRRWTQDHLDEQTGEIVSVPREEWEFPAGKEITNNEYPRLLFLLQSGEIEDVAVRVQCIPNRYFPFEGRVLWEVTLMELTGKYKFLVCARWMEEAVRIACEYAAAYRMVPTGYIVEKCQRVRFILLEMDEERKTKDEEEDYEEEEEHDFDWFRVTVLSKWIDTLSDKQKQERIDYVLRAHDVGEAKKNVLFFKVKEDHKWTDDPMRSHVANMRHTVIKAQPYEVTDVVPAEYSEYYDGGPSWTGC